MPSSKFYNSNERTREVCNGPFFGFVLGPDETVARDFDRRFRADGRMSMVFQGRYVVVGLLPDDRDSVKCGKEQYTEVAQRLLGGLNPYKFHYYIGDNLVECLGAIVAGEGLKIGGP